MSDRPPAGGAFRVTARLEVQDVRRERRNAALMVVAALAALVGAPWALGALGAASLGWLAGLVALGTYFWSALALASTDRGPGERHLMGGWITIEGDRLIAVERGIVSDLPLSGLRGGWTEWTSVGHAAVLSFADGRVVAVERPSEEEATALLAAAGAAAESRAVRMRSYREDAGGRKIAGFFLAFFALLFVPLVLAIPINLVVALLTWSAPPFQMALGFLVGNVPLAVLCGWLWSKVRPTWIQIGTDGVLLHGAFRDRFVPHAKIKRAVHTKGGVAGAYHFVRIDLEDGRSHRIPAANEGEAATLIHRLEAARSVAGTQDRARLLEIIARDGRPLPEWKRALATVMARAGYRTAGHDLEEMMRIVEDPAAPREQRIAAALAARPHGGDDAARRIRVAAGACAEPKLRVALESASSGEIDDALLEDLATREPPPRQAETSP